MITSSGTPTTWNGAFVTKGSFADRFRVVDTEYDEVMGNYSVTVIFDKSPDKSYVFDIDEDKYSTDKKVLATEILRQLQNG